MKYVCVCGYIYDEDLGDRGKRNRSRHEWEDVPEDFTCPICGLGKDSFTQE